MKTKTIFNFLAFAMLMAAMVLTTACSGSDDLADNKPETTEPTEPVAKKGYELPVTINVTRQGDDATRATYNESTRELEFSAGDKLFVSGNDNSVGGAGQFAGELTWQSGTTFSGTIYTQEEWTGTADALFTAASAGEDITATLLPNDYNSYTFLSISEKSSVLYDDEVGVSASYAFVASETAKATGVEQLSYERATTYSSGFALAPGCAVLNFTIYGLEAGAKGVTLYVTPTSGSDYTVTGSVTPNASGVATFAIGVPVGANIKDMSNNLIVGTHNFTLPSTTVEAGKIYNITRNKTLDNVAAGDIGKIVGKDGIIYATKAAAEAVATGNAVAMIAYVGTASDCAHGLAIALADESSTYNYNSAVEACSGKTPVTGGTGTWRLPSIKDWQYMFIGCGASGSYSDNPYQMRLSYSGLASKLTTAQGDALKAAYYWSSTENIPGNDAWSVGFDGSEAYFSYDYESYETLVRACLAF